MASVYEWKTWWLIRQSISESKTRNVITYTALETVAGSASFISSLAYSRPLHYEARVFSACINLLTFPVPPQPAVWSPLSVPHIIPMRPAIATTLLVPFTCLPNLRRVRQCLLVVLIDTIVRRQFRRYTLWFVLSFWKLHVRYSILIQWTLCVQVEGKITVQS